MASPYSSYWALPPLLRLVEFPWVMNLKKLRNFHRVWENLSEIDIFNTYTVNASALVRFDGKQYLDFVFRSTLVGACAWLYTNIT